MNTKDMRQWEVISSRLTTWEYSERDTETKEAVLRIEFFKNIIKAALISVLSLTTTSQAIAKPQNPRSKMMNQFHSDIFSALPPFRAHCPSWQDVLAGRTFERQEDTFKDLGKSEPINLDWQSLLEDEKFDTDTFIKSSWLSNRPCFVFKTSHIQGISDYAGNKSFGRNYSVYSNFDADNHFDVDVPLTFYTGGIGGPEWEKYKQFTKDLQECLQINTIPLKTESIPEGPDQEELEQMSLKVNVPVMISHEDENKYDKYTENPEYRDTTLDKWVFWVNLHTELKRNNIANWNVKISCADITQKILEIAGLHTTFNTNSTYNGLIPTDADISLRWLQRRHCTSMSGEECEQFLISEDKVQVEEETPIFDCRRGDIYWKPNIMNYAKIFDVEDFPIGYSICKSRVSVSTDMDNVDISIQHKEGKKTCDIGDETVITSLLRSEKSLKLVDKHIKEKISKPGEVYYVPHHNRQNEEVPHNVTHEQVNAILYPNYLLNPLVRSFTYTAQNAYRSEDTLQRPFNGCRR